MTAPTARPAHLTGAELDDLVDEALGGPERSATEAHVAGCARCAGALDDARALLAASRALARGVAAPPELWTRVAAATVYERAVGGACCARCVGPCSPRQSRSWWAPRS